MNLCSMSTQSFPPLLLGLKDEKRKSKANRDSVASTAGLFELTKENSNRELTRSSRTITSNHWFIIR